MAEIVPENQDNLGHYRERSSHTDMCRHLRQLSCGDYQHDMRLERSTYEVLQILRISLTNKTLLQDLFKKTYFNEVKEQLSPFIPGLFD